MKRSAHVAMQALKAGLKAKTPFLVTPGSERIYQTIKRDGMMATFEQIGGTVLANACGPCIGQWKRSDVGKDEANTIVSSFNRNFPGRNDGSAATLSFLTSPEIVTALVFAGTLEFDPVHGTHPGARRQGVPLHAAGVRGAAGQGLRQGRGRLRGARRRRRRRAGRGQRPTSERIQLLQPFPRWDGKDFDELPILVKTKGKTTTDHISPAGAWLLVRGHLDKISDNMFLGAVNAFTGEAGKGVNPITGREGAELLEDGARAQGQGPGLGRHRRRELRRGLEPRARRDVAALPRLQGRHRPELRPHPRDQSQEAGHPAADLHEAVGLRPRRAGDRVSVTGLAQLAPGKPVTVVITKPGGKTVTIQCQHTLTDEQIGWFKAGSALNALT